MKNKIKTIQKLMNKYTDIISKDHHKSCDGQWSIRADYDVWDDSGSDWWSVEHNGYINYYHASGSNLNNLLDDFIEQLIIWINKED